MHLIVIWKGLITIFGKRPIFADLWLIVYTNSSEAWRARGGEMTYDIFHSFSRAGYFCLQKWNQKAILEKHFFQANYVLKAAVKYTYHPNQLLWFEQHRLYGISNAGLAEQSLMKTPLSSPIYPISLPSNLFQSVQHRWKGRGEVQKAKGISEVKKFKGNVKSCWYQAMAMLRDC